MGKKYTNTNPISLFGNDIDPFADRKGTGPVRPTNALPRMEPDFRKEFASDRLYFSWLGHSSVFLHMNGMNILIDPVFSNRTSPVSFLGPKRFPGQTVRPADFSEIDLVLISHNHYDHLDKTTIKAIDSKVTRYIVPLGVGSNLRSFGISTKKITELDWYEEQILEGLRIICTPSQHGSARSPFDSNQTLWSSFVLKNKDYTVFNTGDGGFGPHFQDISDRFGKPDLAIMECGQYNERWHGVHMYPEESVQAASILGTSLAIPVHWGAYVLSNHPWDDPPKRFTRRAEELGVPHQIPTLNEIIEIRTKPQ